LIATLFHLLAQELAQSVHEFRRFRHRLPALFALGVQFIQLFSDPFGQSLIEVSVDPGRFRVDVPRAARIALDGTFHPVNRLMRAHPRCRCTTIPAVCGVQVDRGVDWFKQQPADVRRDILGTDAAYEAIRARKLKLEDLVGLNRSLLCGDSYVQLGVNRALAGDGKFPGDTGTLSIDLALT
jgi:hypothetical protein